MATSDSENVPESSSNHYRRSTSPEVVCFSEPEIMPENDKTTIKAAQHEGDNVWKRKNALKKKKYSDTGPSETARQSFNTGGSFKRSNSNPELSLLQGGEGEGTEEQQPRRRGVQFLQGSPLSNRHLVTRSAGVSRIRPSPLVTSSLTYYSNNETDGGMKLVPELDCRQYHLDVDSDEDDDSSNEDEEGDEVVEELEGQELEKQEEFEEELMNSFNVDSSSMPPNPPNMHTDTRKISVVSLTGYQGDEEVLSEDDRWLSRPSDDGGMTRLHSQELLNELFFKFRYVRSSLKHHGRRRTFRKRAATESKGKFNALDMIQKRNSDIIITNDHSLSEEEEDDKELEKKMEGERERVRRATMQADSSLYNTKKKKKERKVLESVGAGASMSPRQRKIRAQSVAVSGPSGNNRYKSSSPDLSLLDRKKPPGSPKAPHLHVPKLKLHNPKSAEKLRKHLETKKYDQVQRDERMDTPLHAIVRSDRRDKLECLLTLMVYSDYGTENIDVPAAFGNTALHIAVQKGDLLMVRLLIVFGANIDAINDQKRTPLDMLINRGNDRKFSRIIEELKRLDAKHGQEVVPVQREKHHSTRLVSISVDLPERQEKFTDRHRNQRSESIGMGIEKPRALSTDGLSPAVIAQKLETNLNELYDEYDRIHNFDMQIAIGLQQFELFGWKKTSSSAMKFNVHGGSRILFLDGGGIRGLIQIELMSIIEQRTGRTITELFDWIVGTSTGGVVALGLVYGKKTLAELRQFYFKLKEDVFSSQGIGGLGGFNTEELERILKEVLGTEMRMSDIKEPKVLISAVNKSTTKLQLNFFNNCFDDEFSNEIVWKVARYTSAAPGYFSECDDYVDGGVLANNPNDYGLTAIQNFHRQKGRKLDIACVVSIGTGIFPAIRLGNIDAHKKLISVKAFGNLITLLTKALVESEDVATNCKSRCEEQHIPFFRYCPHLDTEVASGETDSYRLIDMLLNTKYQAVNEWDEKLEDLAYIFSRIEEYSRKEMLQHLRDRRRLRTMISQNNVIPEEQ